MAYIKPEGTIYLLQRIPLRPDLNMTIYPWASKETQFNWFLKHKLYTYEGTTRVRGNTVMVEIETDRVLHCNYMMFQNKGYSNKWFYAFVTNVEFVNNVTTRLTFQLDLFQTWCFDWDIQPCFVDREHVNDDSIGANTVPEGLEHGDYIASNSVSSGAFSTYNTGMLYAPEVSDNPEVIFPPVVGDYWGKVYVGLQYKSGSLVDIGGTISKFIKNGNTSSIVAVFMIPTAFDTPGNTAVGMSIVRPSYGFTPKNNKLFTGEFMYCLATNLEGGEMALPFELFSNENGSATFSINGCRSASFSAVMYPTNYKGVFDRANALRLGGFPLCAYQTSSYQEYLARTQSQVAVQKRFLEAQEDALNASLAAQGEVNAAASKQNALGYLSAFNTALGATSRASDMMIGDNYSVSGVTDYVSGMANAAAQVASTVWGSDAQSAAWKLQGISNSLQNASIQSQIQMINAQRAAHAVGGSSGAGTASGHTEVNANMKDFRLYSMRIKDEFARIIDDYFSLYGYAVHRVKVPNFEGRYTWNYVKTAGCVFKGYDIPLQMQMQLAASLDAGMTFWHTPDNFGDYTQDNSIK